MTIKESSKVRAKLKRLYNQGHKKELIEYWNKNYKKLNTFPKAEKMYREHIPISHIANYYEVTLRQMLHFFDVRGIEKREIIWKTNWYK